MGLFLTTFILFFAGSMFAQSSYPLDSEPTGTGLTGYYWSIRQIVQTPRGIAIHLPEEAVVNIEFSEDLMNWVNIGNDVTSVFSDTEPSRTNAKAAYYRGVISNP